jgi:hypothetical protein
MPDSVLVFYGSYRATRVGIRMASFVINELRAYGALFAESSVRRSRRFGLAPDPVGDGHGCHLKHSGGGTNNPDPRRAR